MLRTKIEYCEICGKAIPFHDEACVLYWDVNKKGK